MNNLVVISADDWEGIYLNDKLLDEGHKITKHQLVDYMREYNTFEVYFEAFTDEGCRWIEDQGSLPSKYEDIPESLIY